MAFFAVEPWEYPGAIFDSEPQATVRFELGGKRRTFWLKMREGVIYFREPSLVPTYAVPHLFDPSSTPNADDVIEAWKEAVGRQNYGAFIISHRQWPNTPASANYCIILRADGSGWIKEHFDLLWQAFALPNWNPLDLWRPSPTYGDAAQLVVRATHAQFLERSVNPTHFRTIAPHWTGGGCDEMLEVLRSAACLLFKPEEFALFAKGTINWNCKSGSAFWAGSVSSSLVSASPYHFNLVWNIAKWHYGFVGVEWKKATEHPPLQAQFGARTWKRGIERWGENWRGNWVGRQYEDKFSTPPPTAPSRHEKLEAVLVLRDFLHGKMPTEKIDALLGKVLTD